MVSSPFFHFMLAMQHTVAPLLSISSDMLTQIELLLKILRNSDSSWVSMMAEREAVTYVTAATHDDEKYLYVVSWPTSRTVHQRTSSRKNPEAFTYHWHCRRHRSTIFNRHMRKRLRSRKS
jgi:hypothetical protein